MAGGIVSQETGFKTLGLDWREEARRQLEDAKFQSKMGLEPMEAYPGRARTVYTRLDQVRHGVH